jgi:ferric-dicitrate binding protein FerR (iron transport regulator)
LVLERLERHFGVNFDLADARNSKCRFTGTFEKPEMDEVLKVLSLSVGLEVQQKEGVYHVKGGQCP